MLDEVTEHYMFAIVKVYQQDANLRNQKGLDVYVGNHEPMPGGPGVPERLKWILDNLNDLNPYRNHVLYESLHPFTDGNGRSGRALWTWQMHKEGHAGSTGLGFLHTWYYQSLAALQ